MYTSLHQTSDSNSLNFNPDLFLELLALSNRWFMRNTLEIISHVTVVAFDLMVVKTQHIFRIYVSEHELAM